MSTIQNFEEIEIWKDARALCNNIMDLINENEMFQRDYALRYHISRSTGSIMDNIAEGFGRGRNKEFHNFLSYSMGSCLEAKSQIYRAFDFHYIDKTEKEKMLDKIDKLSSKIIAFMSYLKKTDIKGSKYGK